METVQLSSPLDRARVARHGKYLEYFTVVWNLLECVIGVAAGLIAGSVSLVGFGIDSAVEVTSGASLLWRMNADDDPVRRERVEYVTLRIVGMCFLVLAGYVAYSAVGDLLHRQVPQSSLLGIALAIVSLVVMPLLARAKRHVALQLRSSAMAADAQQTQFCFYLSAILLGGLSMNALFGLWWADPAAALVMVPIITREGVQSLRGEKCCD